MNRLSIIAPLALISALASAVPAGVIRGRVVVPARPSAASIAMNAYPGRAGSMPGMRVIERGLVTDAIVYVDHVPAGAESALAAPATTMPRLAQKDQAFAPRVLAVAVGTRVDFPNQDPIYHNVFSFSPVRRFDLGKYPRGESRQIVFSRPGLVNVFCDIHSDMEAFVLVLPHHGFTQPSVSGAFALPELPAGHYIVHAWQPDLGEVNTTVEVPETGDVTATLSF
jgi:plastocyanin